MGNRGSLIGLQQRKTKYKRGHDYNSQYDFFVPFAVYRFSQWILKEREKEYKTGNRSTLQ